MEKVFLLWHTQELKDGEEDEKLIGVYRTEADAKNAVERVGDKPGFAMFPSGFEICPYELNQDHWIDGFVMASD